MKTPHIKTALPGPKAEAMLKRDALVVSPSYPRDYPFVISHAQGRGSVGRRRQPLPRLHGGHRRVRAPGTVIRRSCRRSPRPRRSSCTSPATTGTRTRSRSARRSPRSNPVGGPAMSFFCQSGTEAVEAALKLARNVSGRGRFIGFPRRLPRPHDGLAVVHVQQVHAAEGLLPDDARRHARAVSESVSAAVRGQRSGRGSAQLHREGAVRRATCRRTKSPRS